MIRDFFMQGNWGALLPPQNGDPHIQLNPALTDFRGPTIFFCYRRTSVIANKRNKKN